MRYLADEVFPGVVSDDLREDTEPNVQPSVAFQLPRPLAG